MEFDDAKENIQPLAAGRNASILQLSLRDSHELHSQRQQYEETIHNYQGDDPLEPWYNYILWIEQSYPSGGKESGLEEVLVKCLMKFEKEERYYQDRRMVKLYMKYIDSHENPTECYQQLYNAGIGTMVADLYMGWSYYYDANGNFPLADQIFRKGIDCKAQPLDELKEAYKNFGFVMSQRILHKDNESQESYQTLMHEKRSALTSLRGHKQKKLVGSIRTGAAIKSHTPGKVESKIASNQRNNSNVHVFEDNENRNPNAAPPLLLATDLDPNISKSVVQTILETTRNQENLKEPGPWNSAHKNKTGKLYSSETSNQDLNFEILEDEQVEATKKLYPPIKGNHKFDLVLCLPKDFIRRNKPQEEWNTPVTLENETPSGTLPGYDKCMMYPKPNLEISPEELRTYRYFKKEKTQNKFTNKYDLIWGDGPTFNLRLYPNFAKKNNPQKSNELDNFFVPDYAQKGTLAVPFDIIYSKEKFEEFQSEELIYQRYIRGERKLKYDCNETFYVPEQMEETVCMSDDAVSHRRKSFFPSRKSIAPPRYSMVPGPSRNSIANNNRPDCLTIQTSVKKTISPIIDSIEENPKDDFVFKKPNTTKQNPSDAEEKVHLQACQGAISKLTLGLFKPVVMEKKLTIFDDSSIKNQIVEREETPNGKNALTSAVGVAIYEDNSSETQAVVHSGNDDQNISAKNNQIQIFEDSIQYSSRKPITKERLKVREEVDPSESEAHGSDNVAQNENQSPVSSKIQIFEDSIQYQSRRPIMKERLKIREDILTIPEPADELKSSKEPEFVHPPNKIEIYEDCTEYNIRRSRVPAELKQNKELEANTFYDINDTCSTQVFNCFLKAQSVSTPKVIQKTQQRAFGTILPSTDTPGDHVIAVQQKESIKADDIFQDPSPVAFNAPATTATTAVVTATSPPEYYSENYIGKQLSTIMESTSEQLTGTTSTKSSISSPENATDDSKIPQSTSQKEVKNVCKDIQNSIGSGPSSVLKEQERNESNFQFMRNVSIKNVGNFSRLEEGEDTAMLPLQSIKFQEDKTETITKIVYPEFAKQSMELTNPLEQLQTSTKNVANISKLENTENMAANPLPSSPKDKIEKITKIVYTQPSSTSSSSDHKNSDSFEDFNLFTQTPPEKRSQLSTIAKNNQNQNNSLSFLGFDANLSKLKTTRNDSLRFLESKNTFSELMTPSSLQKSQIEFKTIREAQKLVEETIPSTSTSLLNQFQKLNVDFDNNSLRRTQSSQQVDKTKFNDNENFMFDSSISKLEITKSQPKTDNSFMSNFSIGSNEKLHATLVRKSEKKSSNDSFLPDFSIRNDDKKSDYSFCMDFSMNKSSKTAPSSNLSFLPNFKNPLKEPPRDNVTNKISESSVVRKSRLPIFDPSKKSCTSSSQFDLQCNPMKTPSKVMIASSNTKTFCETNNDTDAFSSNISLIKHSTLIQPPSFLVQDQIKEQSIHIKEEIVDETELTDFKKPSIPVISKKDDVQSGTRQLLPSPLTQQNSESNLSNEVKSLKHENDSKSNIKPLQTPSSLPNNEFFEICESDGEDDKSSDNEMSIYVKNTPKTPKIVKHVWKDSDDHTPNQNDFVYRQNYEFNESQMVIYDHCKHEEVNPFSSELIDAFIDKYEVVNHIKEQPNCQLVGKICVLRKDATIKVNNISFEVMKLIGEGSYGVVFCGKETKTGKKYALKQERPFNIWEYYICSEVHSRLLDEEMHRAFMEIEYALIGNNASILIYEFFPYGSIITICNKIKKYTSRGIDEYVVMHITSQLLQIIDHLHAANIIHADIKADNFILMEKLQYGKRTPTIQLIDFGVSIDMALFQKGQTFKYINNDNDFKCVEMHENRPWTYQLDLFGLAGVIHVLLFGKYMEIVKKPLSRGIWTHKTHMPRYFKKDIWDTIFHELLNIKDCQTMPNLQKLRVILEEEMADKEKYVTKKISEFNRALDA